MIAISLTSNIKYNLKQYFEKKFLDKALYTNIHKNDLFYSGNNPSVLHKNGNTFESVANEWVYEQDISPPTGVEAPINVSGVYVNNTFYANDSSPYYPSPDYLHGRIVFRSPPSDSDTVQAEFSYKDCVIDYVDSDINNILQTQYIGNPDYDSNNVYPSGLERILPAMIIEPTIRSRVGRQIGGGDVIDERVTFFIYSALSYEKDAVADIVYDAVREVIAGVDYKQAPEILNYKGDRSSSYETYTQMQSNYFWTNIYIDDMKIVERTKINKFIYMARIDILLKIYID